MKIRIICPLDFTCYYCERALEALDDAEMSGLNFEVVIEKRTTQDLSLAFGESFTVPRVYVDDEFIGGYDKLRLYLDAKLKERG